MTTVLTASTRGTVVPPAPMTYTRTAAGSPCTVGWHIPGATGRGTATFRLDVTADGRYVADRDGPKEVNGHFWVHTSTGTSPNPHWHFDGFVDLLTPISKG